MPLAFTQEDFLVLVFNFASFGLNCSTYFTKKKKNLQESCRDADSEVEFYQKDEASSNKQTTKDSQHRSVFQCSIRWWTRSVNE